MVARAGTGSGGQPEHRSHRGTRASVHQLPHHGHLFVESCLPAHRPQPSLGGHGQRLELGHRLPGSRGHVASSAGNLGEILRPFGYGTDRPDYHLTEDLLDRSIEFVRDQVSVCPEKPFFLYFCPFACHCPYHAPQAFIDKQRGRYDRGWDVVRAERLARQKSLGVVPAHTKLPPRNPNVEAWDDLSDDARAFTARIFEAYAAMLEHTDAEIGRLMAHLEKIGKLDDTLIVLVSDNGATREGGSLGDVNW